MSKYPKITEKGLEEFLGILETTPAYKQMSVNYFFTPITPTIYKALKTAIIEELEAKGIAFPNKELKNESNKEN